MLLGASAKGVALGWRAGKTLTAPLDRVKLLLQTRGGLQEGAIRAAAKGGGVWNALVVIGREEGFMGYWKGNIPQVSEICQANSVLGTCVLLRPLVCSSSYSCTEGWTNMRGSG